MKYIYVIEVFEPFWSFEKFANDNNLHFEVYSIGGLLSVEFNSDVLHVFCLGLEGCYT